jgi:hypothetical protein
MLKKVCYGESIDDIGAVLARDKQDLSTSRPTNYYGNIRKVYE